MVHLDPSGPIVSRLGILKKSSDFIELANTAGIGFDLALLAVDLDDLEEFVRATETRRRK